MSFDTNPVEAALLNRLTRGRGVNTAIRPSSSSGSKRRCATPLRPAGAAADAAQGLICCGPLASTHVENKRPADTPPPMSDARLLDRRESRRLFVRANGIATAIERTDLLIDRARVGKAVTPYDDVNLGAE